MEIVVWNNATSSFAIPTFGNYMLQNIMRNLTKQNDLKLSFVIEPLPLTVK